MHGAACSAQVLSINKALPLQAHPTTSSAGPMHEAHPDVIGSTDSNAHSNALTGQMQAMHVVRCHSTHPCSLTSVGVAHACRALLLLLLSTDVP